MFWQGSGLWFGAHSGALGMPVTAGDKMGGNTECGMFDKTLCDLQHYKTFCVGFSDFVCSRRWDVQM